MAQPYLGETAALLTAVFWTVTALAFESASKRIGSIAVNFLRLFIAFFFLGLFSWISRGHFFPSDAGHHQWVWLSVSGIVGFVIGDLALFQAFVLIGARVSMLIMALVPPITAIIGYAFLNERLSWLNILGMALTISGIALVILGRNAPANDGQQETDPIKVRFSYSASGILLAFLGAVGQAIGLVLSKYGMKAYNAFSASQIRVLSGIIGFGLLIFIIRKWGRVGAGLKNRPALGMLLLGSFFGPFLGVSFSLLSVQYASTGVASTLMSITPVLIIAPAVILFKERLLLKEVVGAMFAVAGVALFFL